MKASKKRLFIWGRLRCCGACWGSDYDFAGKAGNAHIARIFSSFAAGAYDLCVIEELIPEAQEGEHSNMGTIGAAIGFALMMVL